MAQRPTDYILVAIQIRIQMKGSRSTQISIKFFGVEGMAQGKTILDFGGNPDEDPDPWFLKPDHDQGPDIFIVLCG